MRIEVYGAGNLNFVEFNTTGDSNSYVRCDKDSVFIDTEVFNLFSECFEKSNNLYDYFGPTKFNSRNIVILTNELKQFHQKVSKINTYENFLDFIGSKFLGANFILEVEKHDKNWSLNWEFYREKLARINQQLLDVVTNCEEQDKTLWVIGY